MKQRNQRFLAAALTVPVALAGATWAPSSTVYAASGGQYVEYLDRGISAINTGAGMLVSWRYLANDNDQAEFRLYRDNNLIYTSTGDKGTCYLDKEGNSKSQYRVDSVSGGKVITSETCKLISNNSYFDIPLTPPTGSGCTYSPNDCSVGDVDGDGQYELFIKWDPSNSKDNSQKGKTGNVFIDCVRLDGKRLWRIDLGVNIRAGAHYTQFYVADFDLDGKAEMTCKTADGTIDGTGKAIGDKSANYCNGDGLIITGPEYYTLFDGETGKALDTINYEPSRGDTTKWGKSSDKFNRVDRFWGMVAYLDGVHPSVVTGRGYYGRMTATAYKVENKKLVKLWAFDTGTSSSAAGYGDGNHNSMPADVDGDGKQEIITGATCIDDNGKLLWNTNTGHGDAMHLGDFLPTRAGLELWICHEDKPYGVSLIDAKTGKTIFRKNGSGDTGRCCADNVWAKNPGAEFWGLDNNIYDGSGNNLTCRRPAINFLSYWDGDLEREILDGYTDSPATISKMQDDGTLKTILSTDGFYTCNTTKGTPCLSADIFGDWREELVVRAADSKSVRIYTTPYSSDYRITTLMHDPQYRMQVSAQNTAYNQPPHPSFYLGSDQPLPARPDVVVNGGSSAPVLKNGSAINTNEVYYIQNANSGLYLSAENTPANGVDVIQSAKDGATIWKVADAGDGYYYLYADDSELLLDLDYGKQDNGTNIQLWGNTNADAQKFKFVENGDGSYTICTAATADESCIGITGGSQDAGASAIQWACDGSANQNWILEVKIQPIQGNLVHDLLVYDRNHASAWTIAGTLQENATVFGDRSVTYSNIPEELLGAEQIITACDGKTYTATQAVFTAAEAITVSVLLDTRVSDVQQAKPAWLSDWTQTDLNVTSSNDVTFYVYRKDFAAGEKVVLGDNGTAQSVVNYTVLVQPQKAIEDTTTTTTPPISDDTLRGDVDCSKEVNVSDAVLLARIIVGDKAVVVSDAGMTNADCDSDGKISDTDLTRLLQYLARIIPQL